MRGCPYSTNGKTVSEVIRTLNTLMAVGNTGDWRLTAVTKSVREIFRLFGLEERADHPGLM